MISKGIKYFKSLIRIIFLKIRYGKRLKLKFNIKNLKSLYIGKNINIKIAKHCQIRIGKGVYISDYCKFECNNGEIIIGNDTYFNEGCKIICMEKIQIGENCLFAPNVSIYDHDHRFDDKKILINNQGFKTDKITIKENIWIGTNCVVTKGTVINERVVVGANSLIKGNLISNNLYAGSPVKIIKEI